MKIIFKLFTLFFLTYSLGTAQNGKNFIDQPYMEVTGKSKMEIIPDEIYVRIELNENDKKGRVSIEKQENKMINKLKKLNIDLNEDLSVISFSGYYKRKFLAENGITKRKSYQLVVHSGKMLGEVFQSLDEIDISSFYIMRTSHSNIEELKEKNKVDALTKAKKKAAAFAVALKRACAVSGDEVPSTKGIL